MHCFLLLANADCKERDFSWLMVESDAAAWALLGQDPMYVAVLGLKLPRFETAGVTVWITH